MGKHNIKSKASNEIGGGLKSITPKHGGKKLFGTIGVSHDRPKPITGKGIKIMNPKEMDAYIKKALAERAKRGPTSHTM